MRRDLDPLIDGGLQAPIQAPIHAPIAAPWPQAHPFGNERLWLDCLVEREILRLRARYELSLDELRGLYISDRQVDALLRQQAGQHGQPDADPAGALTRQAAQWREHFNTGSPLALLGERLALAPADLELLFVVLAPELDLRYETLYAYLNNDIARKFATVDMARRLLGADVVPHDAAALRSRIGMLAAAGILVLADSGEPRSTLGQGLALAPPVAQFLLGIPPAAQQMAGMDEPWLEAVADAIGTIGAPAAGSELIACRSDDPERQAGWARRLLARRGRHALHLAPHALLAGTSPLLTARLAHAALVLHDAAGTSRDAAADERLAGALRRALDAGLDVLWLVPPNWRPLPALSRLPLTTFTLAAATGAERAQDWADAIHDTRLADAGPPAAHMAEALAARFSLSGTRIRQAVRAAQALWAADPAIASGREALDRAARQLAAQGLAQVAELATRPHRWPQLVLPATTLQLLHEIAAAIACRERVFRDWNMQGRTGRSAGLMLLFAGASGTGKTMAASVLANHAGLDLFRVDLASVVSKYIGETEKNLERIFSAAQDADAILLFDEADALLGKRAEVKDAHDRYANIEVAYLLQRMETHDGVVILASNLPKNLDPAFARRMHYTVEFGRPNAVLREQLWRGMFPAEVPLAGDIDYAFVAGQFELTGGDIQTIALEAAFLAAGEGSAVGMAQLMRALSRRQTKHGDPGAAARLRAHQAVSAQGRA
ncbi:ATP-binding protein [Cupriavidus oxalaticus]|uniref:AAA ATPase central domain protein n=4 Tax=Cupriavidus oxalaticus TaxID=96344 RepID=A0A976BJR3_9BURK|nr:ATP-binding protein [Cupriavidus oxalaticus]QRQ85037.1 ATP-binding protein [Cupriavidus oxalaticus]QRQ90875.1 ATP-binding protein [Cupriavidus oxalaticus]WQD85404.1 ATP-binding protein [Cupriavidus oxalaticus]SPC22031.1 AAA ATPase central domain protein [Cupriavidus oxalaticus]